MVEADVPESGESSLGLCDLPGLGHRPLHDRPDVRFDSDYRRRFQNHIDTEKLVSSLRIACHHPGGKNNKSPGSRITAIARGTTFSQN